MGRKRLGKKPKLWILLVDPIVRTPRCKFGYRNFYCKAHHQRVSYDMCWARTLRLRKGLGVYTDVCRRCNLVEKLSHTRPEQ